MRLLLIQNLPTDTDSMVEHFNENAVIMPTSNTSSNSTAAVINPTSNSTSISTEVEHMEFDVPVLSTNQMQPKKFVFKKCSNLTINF